MKIISWNVNGIRAISKKGFFDWLEKTSPDILCIQETKAQPDQLGPELLNPKGYYTYWHSAERKGYSSVATFCKTKPLSISLGVGTSKYDCEGRILITEHPGFKLFNIYFPNGKRDEERLKYKLDFYNDLLKYWQKLLKKGEKLVICGDYNTAHKPIDLTHPKANEDVSGFLPIEREWIDQFVETGFIDTFREFNQEPKQYTWWDYQTKARERNVGWRIDYHFISSNLRSKLKDARIFQEVMGSDHCPVYIELD